MDPPGSAGTDARNGSDAADAEANSSAAAVPLLLNPAYARTKSIVHDELRNFRICLKWCALDHSSPGGRSASYAAFVALAVVLPAATSLSVRPPPSAAAIPFYQMVQLPESGLAAISFLTLAAFFRRHGLRQLLFLDGALRDDSAFVRRGYDRELDRAFRRLAAILLPSFSVELAHKILFFSSVSMSARLPFQGPVPWHSVAFVATLASWVYRTGVFLLVCVLFRLTCELQILRFEGFYKMFEDDEEELGAGRRSGNAWAILREHLRIKRQLLVISHRYRIFIIGCMVIISVSQLGALMLVLASKSQKNFCNSGDLVVCSAVQITGFFMCLLGAARITHRAQRVVSVASRWHAIMSCAPRCTSDASQLQKQTPAPPINELHASDRDHECNLSKEPIMSSSHQDTSFESRQALGENLSNRRRLPTPIPIYLRRPPVNPSSLFFFFFSHLFLLPYSFFPLPSPSPHRAIGARLPTLSPSFTSSFPPPLLLPLPAFFLLFFSPFSSFSSPPLSIFLEPP